MTQSAVEQVREARQRQEAAEDAAAAYRSRRNGRVPPPVNPPVEVEFNRPAPMTDGEFRRKVVARLGWIAGGLWLAIATGLVFVAARFPDILEWLNSA